MSLLSATVFPRKPSTTFLKQALSYFTMLLLLFSFGPVLYSTCALTTVAPEAGGNDVFSQNILTILRSKRKPLHFKFLRVTGFTVFVICQKIVLDEGLFIVPFVIRVGSEQITEFVIEILSIGFLFKMLCFRNLFLIAHNKYHNDSPCELRIYLYLKGKANALQQANSTLFSSHKFLLSLFYSSSW